MIDVIAERAWRGILFVMTAAFVNRLLRSGLCSSI